MSQFTSTGGTKEQNKRIIGGQALSTMDFPLTCPLIAESEANFSVLLTLIREQWNMKAREFQALLFRTWLLNGA